MKFVILENRLREFLKRRFALDLTNKIKMVTSSKEVPYEISEKHRSRFLNKLMNLGGPMYLIKHLDEYYLIQPRYKDNDLILDTRKGYLGKKEFFDKLGMPAIISIDDLINAFYTEDEDYSPSAITESEIKFRRRLKLIDKCISQSIDTYIRSEYMRKVSLEEVINSIVVDASEYYFFLTADDDALVNSDDVWEFQAFLRGYIDAGWMDKILSALRKESITITESEKDKNIIKLKRRMWDLEGLVRYHLKDFDRICDYPVEVYVDSIGDYVAEDIYWNYFPELEDDSEEYKDIYDTIKRIISEKYFKLISEYYNSECKDFKK